MTNDLNAKKFQSHMTAKMIETMKPKPGDFFLTASHTSINKKIRNWSGSKYGHGIIYLGPMDADTVQTQFRKKIDYPQKTEKYCAFELPINCTGLQRILEKDGCFKICHVTPKNKLSEKEIIQIKTFCRSFTAYKGTISSMDKKRGESELGGYSNIMALVYAPTDTFMKPFLKNPATAEFVPFAHGLRISVKILNAFVQSVVHLSDVHPNLNCTSLISWIYKELDRPITTFSATTSPDDLYLAVTKNAKFKVKEYKVEEFDKPKPVVNAKPTPKDDPPKTKSLVDVMNSSSLGDVAI